MPPPSRRTANPGSAPTTTSSTPRASRSSSTVLRGLAASLPHDHAKTAGLPSAKLLGAARGRAKAFRPNSIINISGTSFGSVSGNAIKALNGGAGRAGCLHNTGEGGQGDQGDP